MNAGLLPVMEFFHDEVLLLSKYIIFILGNYNLIIRFGLSAPWTAQSELYYHQSPYYRLLQFVALFLITHLQKH